MKFATKKEIYNWVMPKLRDLKTSNEKVILYHVYHESYLRDKSIGILANRFINLMDKICEELNIDYRPYQISKYPTTNEELDAILTANYAVDTCGVVYDFPFIKDILLSLYNDHISEKYDIGFDLESTQLFYTNHKYIIDPHRFILDALLKYYKLDNVMLSYTIITDAIDGSYHNLMPKNNAISIGKYDIIDEQWDYEDNFDNDIIISFMRHSKITKKPWYIPKNTPKLVLDFGWSTEGAKSINYNYFTNDTIIYNWDNGLMELFTYAIINNALHVEKLGYGGYSIDNINYKNIKKAGN